MDLYTKDASPFSARVRISIAAKKLQVNFVQDPDTGSDSFRRINPMGQVPVLVLEDGTAIPESDSIVEYLEDAFPETPLRPAEAIGKAKVRLIARVAEQRVFQAVLPIFGAMAADDAEKIAAQTTKLREGLNLLASLLDDKSWHACGSTLTTADGALTPFLFFVHIVGQRTSSGLIDGNERIASFWEGAVKDPVLSRIIGEMGQGMARARG